ncbi:MAG: YfhO family protein [Candidatus Eremiobacterota bacterium]
MKKTKKPSENKYKFNMDIVCVVFIVILMLIFFYDPLFTGKSYFLNDIEAMEYPFHHYKYDMGQAGKLFLWDPYSFCGQPYIADIHTGTFYPLNWIFFFIPTATAIVIYVVIHFLMAGIFSYIFLRDMEFDYISSLAGSIFYSFCGFMVIRIIHVNFTTDCALLPLCLYSVNILFRKKNLLSSLLLSLFLACTLLSGNYQVSLMVYGITFIYFAGKLDLKELKKHLLPGGLFLAAIIFSFMFMAVQLLPTWEYIGQTMRISNGLPYDMATKDSVGLKQLLLFIIPDYFGLPWRYGGYTGYPYFWEACFYVGVFPLLLTLIAPFLITGKEKKIFIILCIIALLGFTLSLGKYTPVYGLFYSIVPLFKSYRFPLRWLLLLLPGMLYSIALSVNRLYNLEKPVTHKENPRLIMSLILAGIIMINLLILIMIVPPKTAAGTISFLVTGITGFIIIFLRLYCIIGKKLFAFLTIASLIISAFSFGLFINLKTERSYFDKRAGDVFDVLKDKIPPERIYYFPPPDLHGTKNMTGTRKISTLIGYNPLILKRYGEYILYSDYKVPLTPEIQLEFIKQSNMIPIKNLTKKMILLTNLSAVYSFEGTMGDYKLNIIPVKNPCGRAFTVNEYQVITDDYKTLQYMGSNDFDPLNKVLLNEDPGIKNTGIIKKENYPVEFQKFEPDYIKMKVSPEQSCWLFLSEIYYPGWKAFVDGKERKVYRANYMFRAIELKQGDNTVEFYFSSDSFRKGAAISLIAVLILTAVLLKDLIMIFMRRSNVDQS